MMETMQLIELLKDYDVTTIIIVLITTYLINKKITIVDKAVNQRPEGQMTLSQEVSEIHRKVDVLAVEVRHIKSEVDEHRTKDEVIFESLANDIKELNQKVA
jgi:hypothetical protein